MYRCLLLSVVVVVAVLLWQQRRHMLVRFATARTFPAVDAATVFSLQHSQSSDHIFIPNLSLCLTVCPP